MKHRNKELTKSDLWDEYSEYIDDDIFSLESVAGTTIMKESAFFKAIDKLNGSKEGAELITTAVNACKVINPDNPLKVAQMLPKIIEGLRQIADSTNGHILDKYDARGFVAIANLLLKQVTE